MKHPVSDQVKPSFVIFDVWALWCSALSISVPGCQKLQMTYGLTRSCTGCFIAVPTWQQWASKGYNRPHCTYILTLIEPDVVMLILVCLSVAVCATCNLFQYTTPVARTKQCWQQDTWGRWMCSLQMLICWHATAGVRTYCLRPLGWHTVITMEH